MRLSCQLYFLMQNNWAPTHKCLLKKKKFLDRFTIAKQKKLIAKNVCESVLWLCSTCLPVCSDMTEYPSNCLLERRFSDSWYHVEMLSSLIYWRKTRVNEYFLLHHWAMEFFYKTIGSFFQLLSPSLFTCGTSLFVWKSNYNFSLLYATPATLLVKPCAFFVVLFSPSCVRKWETCCRDPLVTEGLWI